MLELILQLALALLLGIIAGTITGLLPGIHINLVSVLLISLVSYFSVTDPITLAVFVVSMAIAHTFLDFIPSIYLGAPEEDTFLAVLPGHQLLKEGNGHEAVVLTLHGSLLALAAILIFTPIFILLLPAIENKVQTVIPFVLLFITAYIVLREDQNKILSAIIVFLLSGFLGFAALNLPIKEPLLPLLTGLFGSSALIISLKDKISISKQKIKALAEIKLSGKELKNSILGCLIISPLCSFLPALGSGYAALISSEIFAHSKKAFLFSVGMLNTIIMGLSFVVVYSISKSRTGAAAAVRDLLQSITLQDLTLIIISLVIAGTVSYVLGIKISKIFAKNITKISYGKISLAAIIFLAAIVVIFSNFLGVIVFITSTLLGIFAIQSGIKRIHLMGCLLLPTIIYYLV